MLAAIRGYFESQQVIEVSTPTLASRGVTDCYLDNVEVNQSGQRYFLQTSPEYAMKRLLASHGKSIYQICSAFRGGESGARHSIEFTMLEWYRVGFELEELMTDLERMLTRCSDVLNLETVAPTRVSYQSCFENRFECNPHTLSDQEIKKLATSNFDCQHITDYGDSATRSDYLDVLFSQGCEPALIEPTIVYDYPACQVALATLDTANGVARRFELFVSGVELANGYLELGDAGILEERMSANNRMRQSRGLPLVDHDEKLLAALPSMPACSGIAVGIDRLLMTLLGKNQLSEVMAFTGERV